MTRNLYALLVGINEYDRRSPIPPLKGCVNDIRGMQAYLESRIDKTAFNLHLHTLTNEQATRQAVIDGFRQHLTQAGPTDVVLFYYAGHGAQAKVPKALRADASEQITKTLVCYDSRVNGHYWDLAGPELALLVAEVAQKAARTAVVLDCCYTGSEPNGVPGVTVRRASPDLRARPLESFLVSPTDVRRSSGQSLAPKSITLSACAATEAAQEYYGGGRPQGVFSHFLQKSLAMANGALSYRQLLQHTNALMRSSVMAQSPQVGGLRAGTLQTAAHSAVLEEPFLAGAIAPLPPYFTVSYHPEDGWIVDGGAVDGLVPPTGTETTRLALFPYYSPPAQMQQIEEALAQTTLTQVHPRYSKIDGSGLLLEANPTDLFKAVVIEQPLPLMSVYIEGEAEGVRALKRAIATAANREASVYVQATAHPNDASFRVLADKGTYTITDPTGARPLADVVLGYDAATEVASSLEHMAKWQAIAQFPPSLTSPIQGSVALKIYTGTEPKKEDATEITSAQIRLSYRDRSAQADRRTDRANEQQQLPPRFRVKLHNTSNEPLYCALFYLTERFKSAAIRPDSVSSVVRLLPDQEVWFAGGSPLNGRVPDSVWQKGITECQDMLKLVACTCKFDPTLMNLGELAGVGPGEASGRLRPPTSGGSLDRLMQRVGNRSLSFAGAPVTYDDWTTSQVAFTFVRPQLWVPVEKGSAITIGAPDEQSATVKIHPHPQLTARVRLASATATAAPLPALLQAETVPFMLTQSRATAEGLSVLELTDLAGSVTPDIPLRLETDMPLNEGEYVLPVAFEGDAYVGIGYGIADLDKTQVVIERLANPVMDKLLMGQQDQSDRARASVFIFLRKVSAPRLKKAIAQKMGFEEERSLLTALANAINRSLASHQNVSETTALEQKPNKIAYTARPIPPVRTATITATTAIAATTTRADSQRVFASSPSFPTQRMSSPDPSQPPANEPPASEPPNKRSTTELSVNEPPLNAQSPAQPPQQPPVHPPVPPAALHLDAEPDVIDPADVYAPQYEPSPESHTSPLMWVWVLSTAVLAAIVAIAWIQFLSEPSTPSPSAPAVDSPTIEPALPSVPDSPPVAPE